VGLVPENWSVLKEEEGKGKEGQERKEEVRACAKS